jgi:hypothetical protein
MSEVPKSCKLKGKVLAVNRTEEYIERDGERWKKCIFTLELTSFSKRRPQPLPAALKGKRVKLVRYCCYDRHYKLDVEKTLECDETEAIIQGKPIKTVYW